MALRVKELYRVKTVDKNGKVIQDHESTYVYAHLPYPTKVGQPATYTVVVEYLGEKKYKKSFAQRQKEYDKRQERMKKWDIEQANLKLKQQEKELVQRRKRIMNQIELAFVKKVQGAVDFITCDQCDGEAKFLGLAYENKGSQVIDSEQITSAWCEEHEWRPPVGQTYKRLPQPFKTATGIACARLEFFYDGLRQLCIKS